MNTFRYQPLSGGVMARNDDGDWVCIRDHIRVTAERDALQLRLNAVEEENDRLRSCMRGCGTWPMREAARKAWPLMQGDGVDYVLSCALAAALEKRP